MAVAPIFPASLKSLRIDLGQSVRIFGITLKRAVDPKAERGFSKAYILQLEQGKRPLTPELERAYARLAAALDDVDPDTAISHAARVYAVNDIDGCLVAGQAKQCARPGCRVRFVPTNPAQKYHSAWCRKQSHR